METLKLIIHILCSLGMTGFGIVMIVSGVLNIKHKIETKWFSIVMIPNGIATLALVVMSWFW